MVGCDAEARRGGRKFGVALDCFDSVVPLELVGGREGLQALCPSAVSGIWISWPRIVRALFLLLAWSGRNLHFERTSWDKYRWVGFVGYRTCFGVGASASWRYKAGRCRISCFFCFSFCL